MRINAWSRRSTSLDAEDFERRIHSKGFFMISVKFFIIQPLVCPFSRDFLNSDFAFSLSFMWWSLQLFIYIRRQILSGIFLTNTHLLQLRRLRNGEFELSCK